MSKYLGSNRQYARRQAPSSREDRRRWKGCDSKTGAPVDRSRHDLMRARSAAELGADVMADIQRAERENRVREMRSSIEDAGPFGWNPFDIFKR